MQENAESEVPSTSEGEDLGCPMRELKLHGWKYFVIPVVPSKFHFVLYKLPLKQNRLPEPFLVGRSYQRDNALLPRPLGQHSADLIRRLGSHWDTVKTQLSSPIKNMEQLKKAMQTYNSYCTVNPCFDSYFPDEFFTDLLPRIISLALELESGILSPIPCLRQGRPKSISLSQKQVGVLLANAFLCTYPMDLERLNYPSINFNRLWACDAPVIYEKLNCIFAYFKQITQNMPIGVITYTRKAIRPDQFPSWHACTTKITNMKLNVRCQGFIEQAKGCLQVDFANKLVGGGVLYQGMVQEEIRFIICPEMIASRLFTEELKYNEALIMTGCQQYTSYSGYGDNFSMQGNFNDTTPYDRYGRRMTSVVAMDAIYFSQPWRQYDENAIIRELNKAYVGFYEAELTSPLTPIATGNWGCGAFNGNVQLKSLLQIMACAEARRHMVYFTFGDRKLQEEVHEVYTLLCKSHRTVGELFGYLKNFKMRPDYKDGNVFEHVRQCLDADYVPPPPSKPSTSPISWSKRHEAASAASWSKRQESASSSQKHESTSPGSLSKKHESTSPASWSKRHEAASPGSSSKKQDEAEVIASQESIISISSSSQQLTERGSQPQQEKAQATTTSGNANVINMADAQVQVPTTTKDHQRKITEYFSKKEK